MSILFIISAPSGSGKSTLVNELRKSVPNLEFSISYTTRPPRGNEQNGREYFFITRAEFESMLMHEQFLEYADVFGFYYGTAKRFLNEAEKKGADLLLDIDVQGARQVKQQLPGAVSIFVLPPSRKVLEERLRHRSAADARPGEPIAEEVIQRRLHAASKEIENYSNYDYILINDRLEQSRDDLRAIVLAERIRERLRRTGAPTPDETKILAAAEQCLQSRSRDRVQPILTSFALSAAPSGR